MQKKKKFSIQCFHKELSINMKLWSKIITKNRLFSCQWLIRNVPPLNRSGITMFCNDKWRQGFFSSLINYTADATNLINYLSRLQNQIPSTEIGIITWASAFACCRFSFVTSMASNRAKNDHTEKNEAPLAIKQIDSQSRGQLQQIS